MLNNTSKTPLAVIIFLIFTTISSCNKSKSSPDDKDPEPDSKPTRVTKISSRIEIDPGVFRGDSISFLYREDGLLKGRINLNTGEYWENVYNGDIVSDIVTYSKDGVATDTLSNFMRKEDNGNTIILDYSTPDVMIVVTYKFKDEVIQSYHLRAKWYDQPETGDLYTFEYDASGNLKKSTHTNYYGFSETFTLVEVDNKKNPHYKIPKMNVVFINGWDLYDKGINNPTKIRKENGELIEYEWTYNSNGYPASLRQKGANFVMLYEYGQ